MWIATAQLTRDRAAELLDSSRFQRLRGAVEDAFEKTTELSAEQARDILEGAD